MDRLKKGEWYTLRPAGDSDPIWCMCGGPLEMRELDGKGYVEIRCVGVGCKVINCIPRRRSGTHG